MDPSWLEPFASAIATTGATVRSADGECASVSALCEWTASTSNGDRETRGKRVVASQAAAGREGRRERYVCHVYSEPLIGCDPSRGPPVVPFYRIKYRSTG